MRGKERGSESGTGCTYVAIVRRLTYTVALMNVNFRSSIARNVKRLNAQESGVTETYITQGRRFLAMEDGEDRGWY